MEGRGQRAIVAHVAVGARVLQQYAEQFSGFLFGCRCGPHDDFDTRRLGAGTYHFDGLRQNVVGHVKQVGLRFARAQQQRHRFGSGGRFVEH